MPANTATASQRFPSFKDSPALDIEWQMGLEDDSSSRLLHQGGSRAHDRAFSEYHDDPWRESLIPASTINLLDDHQTCSLP